MRVKNNLTANIGKCKELLAALCLLAILAMNFPVAVAQGTSDPAHAYCVKMGYLYKSGTSENGGQGMCQFHDNSWCDSQAYYEGRCGPSISANIFPSYAYGSSYPGTSSAEGLCSRSGGSLRSVHTPYGDVTLCVFPNGSTCDLQSLASGNCGGVDYWTIYARSWLNAP
jgi:putative hemolysin